MSPDNQGLTVQKITIEPKNILFNNVYDDFERLQY